VDREIIINSAPYEARAAVVEGRRAVELFIERTRDRGVTGNIYKGK
jgi:ribonuclease G